MGSRRDYAASLGLAIAGARGRLSRAANEACDLAEKNGMEFDIPLSAAVTIPRRSKPTVDPKAKGKAKFAKAKVQPLEEEEWNIQDAVYSNSQMWKSTSGQLVNGRAVCSQCGFSLQYHLCKNPSAVVSPGVLESVVLV